MKTLFLLASATVIVSAATAQQRATSVVFNEQTNRYSTAHEPEQLQARPIFHHGRDMPGIAAKTTTGAYSRWYNYGDYLSTTSTVNFAAMYLWNDTTSRDVYSGTLGNEFLFNNMVSVGLVCDPFFSGWNDDQLYSGQMKLTSADAYIIDSVFISGVYYRNNARTAPVDTLTIAVAYGDGTSSSNLHYRAIDTSGGRSWIHNEYNVDSLFYMNMHHDSLNNTVDTFMGGAAPVVNKIYLSSTDTSSAYEAVIPVSINVPAGNIPAITLSFKSGDPTYTFGDTVFWGSGYPTPYKYGMFRPILAFLGTNTAPIFPVNSKDDLSEGEFRDQGYDRVPNGLYRPHWFWYNSQTGGASTYQYPYFAVHVTCATCSKLGIDDAGSSTTAVKAFPNPANDQVTISFNLAEPSDVTVSLTNILGQEVAVGRSQNTTSGAIQFHASSLPGGLYLYTLVANGVRTTGRVVVAH